MRIHFRPLPPQNAIDRAKRAEIIADLRLDLARKQAANENRECWDIVQRLRMLSGEKAYEPPYWLREN